MKFIELFAGIGGFRYGLEMCGESKNNSNKKITRHAEGSESIFKEEQEKNYKRNIKRNEPTKNTNRALFQNRSQQGSSKSKRLDTIKTNNGFRRHDGQDNNANIQEGSKIRNEQESLRFNGHTSDIRIRNSTLYTCVYANEFNKYAAQIYERNFNDRPDTRDITTVPAEEIPDHELLVGGFPCQAFSIAGKRGGFEDTRGTLFFEIARIAKQKQPRLLLLENVKGLLSHDQGKTFGTILHTLSELGYDCEWQVLNSKDFGVPQNRERVFIIGHLRGTSRPEVFPIGGSYTENDEGVKRKKITSSRTRNFGSSGQLHQPDEQCSTLTQSMGTGSNNVPCMVIPTINPDREDIRQSRRFKEDGDPSYTLVSKFVNGVCDGVKIRRLTPTECERLQGFPDGWTEGISDTQRYKCLGNAVTVNVVYEIARRLSGNIA